MKFYSYRIRSRVFLITITVIGCFFLIGAFFDYLAGTHPLGVTLGVLISFPVNVYTLRRYFKHYFSKDTQPSS